MGEGTRDIPHLLQEKLRVSFLARCDHVVRVDCSYFNFFDTCTYIDIYTCDISACMYIGRDADLITY